MKLRVECDLREPTNYCTEWMLKTGGSDSRLVLRRYRMKFKHLAESNYFVVFDITLRTRDVGEWCSIRVHHLRKAIYAFEKSYTWHTDSAIANSVPCPRGVNNLSLFRARVCANAHCHVVEWVGRALGRHAAKRLGNACYALRANFDYVQLVRRLPPADDVRLLADVVRGAVTTWRPEPPAGGPSRRVQHELANWCDNTANRCSRVTSSPLYFFPYHVDDFANEPSTPTITTWKGAWKRTCEGRLTRHYLPTIGPSPEWF